jgi:hypothetical protein
MESRYSIGLLPKYKYRKYNEKEKFQFLQTKIAVLLGFFHMLRPVETKSNELIQKPELKINTNKCYWLRTITKNNKESYSDIWIPNIIY